MISKSFVPYVIPCSHKQNVPNTRQF